MFFAIRDQAQTASIFEMYVSLTGSPRDCGLWIDSPPLGLVSLPSAQGSRLSLFRWGKRLLNYLAQNWQNIFLYIPGARIHHVTHYKRKRLIGPWLPRNNSLGTLEVFTSLVNVLTSLLPKSERKVNSSWKMLNLSHILFILKTLPHTPRKVSAPI